MRPGPAHRRTAPRDSQRHSWYAGHGHTSVRVDARGYGDSEGVPAGAGPAAQTAETEETKKPGETGDGDGVEVVGWPAAQAWCDGDMGMFGISRGGTASLRTAALAPEPLKAVVALCCADDHYDNEGHGPGGSALATVPYARSASALATAALPPDPRYAGASWQATWSTCQVVDGPRGSRPRTHGAPGDGSGSGSGSGSETYGPTDGAAARGAIKAAVPAVGC
ncbi:CocE/NonD family hydrolase [Streptomyces sp. NPDC002514]